jgi:proteic killer suppression protein
VTTSRGGILRFRFRSKKLESLYTAERGAKAFPAQVVDAFFEAMAVIVAAKDERDLRAMKGFHLEKLRGDRAEQSSMRLNKQWRLVVEIGRDDAGQVVVVIGIEDYH